MLYISRNISIQDTEIELNAIRAQGAGGQNVNMSFPRFFVFQEVAFMLPAFLSAEQ